MNTPGLFSGGGGDVPMYWSQPEAHPPIERHAGTLPGQPQDLDSGFGPFVIPSRAHSPGGPVCFSFSLLILNQLQFLKYPFFNKDKWQQK